MATKKQTNKTIDAEQTELSNRLLQLSNIFGEIDSEEGRKSLSQIYFEGMESIKQEAEEAPDQSEEQLLQIIESEKHKDFTKWLSRTLYSLAAFSNSDEAKRIETYHDEIEQFKKDNAEQIKSIFCDAPEELRELVPYLYDVYASNGKHEGEFDIFLSRCFPEGGKRAKRYAEALREACAKKAKTEQALQIIETGEFIKKLQKKSGSLQNISGKGIEKITFPLDKLNHEVWKSRRTEEALNVNMAKHGSGKIANVLYTINFEELEKCENLKITRNLTPFDKRVYTAIGSLYKHGLCNITIKQIYYTMGNHSDPYNRNINDIQSSITKMNMAHIFITNKEECDIYKRRTRFEYDGSLLPMERVTAIVNGNTCDSVIHILKEPPLMEFAESRKQITTIPRILLDSPINKNDTTLSIQDYLTERICHAKSEKGKGIPKILYSTLCEETGQTGRMQKSRAIKNAKTILEYFKECNFILGYTDDKNCFIIDL